MNLRHWLRRQPERYRGHAIAAAPGTHLATAETVARRLGRSASILELGAYTGALLERLRDIGFRKLTAADLDNHLTIAGVPHVRCDFNADFTDRFQPYSFDCVIACEVIEHLDDPRAFLRQCFALLRHGGMLVVSTPNIAFFEGRLKFLLKGELWGFGANNYESQRHITPISRGQFPLLLNETGFHLVEIDTAASYATPLRKILTAPLWAPMRLLLGPSTLGETTVCVGRRAAGPLGNFQSGDLWMKERAAKKARDDRK